MACLALDMYNSDQHIGHHCAPMSPRISFSNGFVDAQQTSKQERSSRDAPVSSDFEFSVSNYSMMSADELFFKGSFLPFKDNQMQRTTTTLREELLVGDDDDDSRVTSHSQRPPKGSTTRWKGLLGLKRTHIIGSSKKADKSDGSSVERVVESKRSGFVKEEAHVSKTSQEVLNEGRSSYRDVEIGI